MNIIGTLCSCMHECMSALLVPMSPMAHYHPCLFVVGLSAGVVGLYAGVVGLYAAVVGLYYRCDCQ